MSFNPNQAITPLAYTISNAVKISGISRSGVYRLLKSGELQAKNLGKRTLVLHDSLKELIDRAPAWVPNTEREI
ncbi:MAG: hypothetical protein B7Z78_11540 [Rhodospirillales bacterium 20-60-12]|nr:MAG: hypothetical protein B7Z78_11540 [Rhodospirillales bacterium 20-60-12]